MSGKGGPVDRLNEGRLEKNLNGNNIVRILHLTIIMSNTEPLVPVLPRLIIDSS